MTNYIVNAVTDLFVLIEDTGTSKSVTNDVVRIVRDLVRTLPGGLEKRRLYYRDSMNRFDEIVHSSGEFKSFAPCTESQQSFFNGIEFGTKSVKDQLRE